MKSRWERMSPEEKEAYIKKIGDSNELVYGTRCTLNAPENIEKKQATWMENLGVDWPSKSSEVVKKALETKLENNGGEF